MTNDQVKVCVVALIGKSQFRQDRNKAWKLNSLVQKNVFKSDHKLKEKFLKKVDEAAKNQPSEADQDVKSDQKEEDTNKTAKSKTYDHNIQTYHDQKNRVIYVHLESIFDTNNIYEILIKNQQNIEDQKNFYEQWESEQLKYLKSVLLIFSISHIVIISNPSCEIDITYIRLFRLIDTLRNKLNPSLVELLKSLDLPIGKDWIYAARPCSPRVLFTFENCPRNLLLDPNSNQVIEKFQHALEDQIYNSLRRSYVITNISNNSIFAIPANQEFVYVHRSMPEATNINKLLMSNPEFNRSTTTATQMSSTNSQHRQLYSAHPLVPNPSNQQSNWSSNSSSSSDVDAKLFREFVFSHIRTALNDGFNDNIGRTNVAPVFELPTPETWYRVYQSLGEFFLAEPVKNAKLASYYSQLKSQIDLDVQFSENRCKKLMQPALGLYQDNLPSHYNKLQHQQRLDKALSLYQTNARGPMYTHYLEQLKRECTNIWTNGRQLCEAISLTGHNCVLELHKVAATDSEETTTAETEEAMRIAPVESDSTSTVFTTTTATSEDESSSHRPSISDSKTTNKRSRSNRAVSGSSRLASTTERDVIKVRPHTSNIVTVAASNCGLFQRERKDPFDLKEANFTFYEDFAHVSELIPIQVATVKYDFPVFKPSGLNAKPAVQEKLYVECDRKSTVSESTSQQQAPAELSVNINLSQDNNINVNSKSPLNLGNNNSEPNQTVVVVDKTTAQHQEKIEEEKTEVVDEEKEKSSPVVINTEVYLNGMTHSDSPAGLLPRFSSWSLVSIGKYTDYNPHTGFSQPGFMSNLNYLIPWEMIISSNTVTSLHDSKTSSRKKGTSESSSDSNSRLKRPGATPSVTLRAFIGAEYECPCGHRFICSGPDRPVRLSNNGVVKDDAYKLLNMDMPLYTACPCRNSKDSTPYMAQLMRIFVVTPSGNIQSDEDFLDSSGQKQLRISIRPRVQPNPTPCPFFCPSLSEPITLSDNSIWVLRLPYIYMGDDGKPYSRPTDFETLNCCKVPKGMFSVSLIDS